MTLHHPTTTDFSDPVLIFFRVVSRPASWNVYSCYEQRRASKIVLIMVVAGRVLSTEDVPFDEWAPESKSVVSETKPAREDVQDAEAGSERSFVQECGSTASAKRHQRSGD
jgi:hypothetical protein